VVVSFGVLPPGAAAQSSTVFIPANGEVERYLRAVELVEKTPRQWGVRGFGPAEVGQLLSSARLQPPRAESLKAAGRYLHFRHSVSTASVAVNTGFPYGFNDGPVWAGRGLTASAQEGLSVAYGPVTASLAPIAFISQNAGFPLVPGDTGRLAFVNPAWPNTIDMPDRFGSRAYGRIDAGDSFVRADAFGLAAGFSTASQVFGPAIDHPLILGNNAGGFPRVFVGTSSPVTLGFLILHGRVEWGQLAASPYTPGVEGERRFASAGVGSISFTGARGLELGAIRFYHTPWPAGGITNAPFLQIFEGLLKDKLATPSNPHGDNPTDNQLASVFLRWTGSNMEAYGEYGREDHNWNSRDFWLEPDHDAAFTLGFQRAWPGPDQRMTVFRAEHLNSRISHLALAAIQVPWYVHGVVREGHTLRGQPLGSAGGFGGGASTIAVDWYSPRSRTTLYWESIMRAEFVENDLTDPSRADVMHAFGTEISRPNRQGWWTLGAAAVIDVNRNFSRDVFNLNLTGSFRARSLR
jgi:hypothetical protein